MTTGIILGRFMPLHEGHCTLIRTGLNLVDRLVLVLATSDVDPIPADMRQAWLGAVFPQTDVIKHHCGATSLPTDDPAWADILSGLAQADYLIGSEAHIKPLAQAIAAQHFILDPMWMAVHTNSADIREDPFAHWADIPGPVRPYYQKRLTLVGGESTGKSFMADYLAQSFGGPYVPEYGRPYEKFRDKGPYTPDELHLIVDGHVAHRKALAPLAGPILFEDTDALLTAVWAEMLLERRLPDLEARIELPDHYLLLDSNVPWEEDPIRYYGSADMRRRFFDKIVAQLERHGAPYTLISGSFAEREAQAVAVAEAILSGEPPPKDMR
ncbi:AAA family ATPase [Halovulum sp. GXIMD14793]